MMMNEHTAKAFDTDLQELTRLVAEMGGLAEKQIADSVDALVHRDAERAMRVVAVDPSIDALQHEIADQRAIPEWRLTEQLEHRLAIVDGLDETMRAGIPGTR